MIVVFMLLAGCTTRSNLAERYDEAEEAVSDPYYKLDTTRYISDFELRQAYEDAVRDIAANGNLQKAYSINFFVEAVLQDDKGNFLIYIDYEYVTT